MSDLKEESFGIYIHIPYCKSKCAYCSFVSDTRFSDCKEYINALIAEIEESAKNRCADTVYIGGGTPSALPRGELSRIMSVIRGNFLLSDDAEISAECNPDSATSGFFGECAKCGVNRVSIGLQSSNDELLKKIGRIHTFSQFAESVVRARSAGINNINADLMLGLPSQTETDVKAALDVVLGMGIEHISVYGLSVEKGTPLFESGYEVDEDRCADFYELCADILKENSYRRYEVSNFAKNGKVCRHNMKYWSGAPYLGFGAAAHSFYGGVRYRNTENREKYIGGERVENAVALTAEDRAEERIMLSLRTDEGLDLIAFEKEFGCDLAQKKSAEIERLMRYGLITLHSGRIRLTEQAYYKMNCVILALL